MRQWCGALILTVFSVSNNSPPPNPSRLQPLNHNLALPPPPPPSSIPNGFGSDSGALPPSNPGPSPPTNITLSLTLTSRVHHRWSSVFIKVVGVGGKVHLSTNHEADLRLEICNIVSLFFCWMLFSNFEKIYMTG